MNAGSGVNQTIVLLYTTHESMTWDDGTALSVETLAAV